MEANIRTAFVDPVAQRLPVIENCLVRYLQLLHAGWITRHRNQPYGGSRESCNDLPNIIGVIAVCYDSLELGTSPRVACALAELDQCQKDATADRLLPFRKTLEYPFGNRKREAELLKRKLERRQAISVLQNLADQVAVQGKQRIRMVETKISTIFF